MNLAIKDVTDSFKGFAKTSRRLLHIQTENDYSEALALVEYLLLTLDESGDDPLSDLLNMVSNAVEVYENRQPDVQAFLLKYDHIPADIAVLKVLMEQHHLGVNDFKNEIGSKSYVSMILNKERRLNKNHIEKLCQRFKLNPGLFF